VEKRWNRGGGGQPRKVGPPKRTSASMAFNRVGGTLYHQYKRVDLLTPGNEQSEMRHPAARRQEGGHF